MKIVRLFLALCIGVNLYSQSFLYPVAACVDQDGSQKIYVIHQISLYQLELWLWDPITTVAQKALPSSYTPAGLHVLPDGTGLSFIDNGLIKIKKFAQQSIKNLTFSDSLYEIVIFEWLDKDNGYCSAKKRDRFGIYHITMDGRIQPLAYSIAYDCMYPAKIGPFLFYIERSEHELGYRYEIIQTAYSQEITDKKISQAQAIIDFADQPIIFLHMLSAQEGFVLGHSATFDRSSPVLTFTYHHLEYTTAWHSTPLFTFDIPSALLLSSGNNRLHESLLPLLPRYQKGCLFFVDSKGTGTLNIFSYNLSTKETLQLTKSREPESAFGAFPFKDFYYYGGSVTSCAQGPSLFSDERGLVYITLPCL